MNTRRPAGFLPRLGAFALDLLPILGYILLYAAVGLALYLGPFKPGPGRASADPAVFDALAFLTVILPVILYFASQEASTRMASWGKRRLGLQVLTRNGGRLGFGRSLLRSAFKFLPWQMAHTALFHIPGWPLAVQTVPTWVMAVFIVMYALLAFYLLTLLIDPHRTPYDWIAGTVVVRAKEE